MTVQDTRDPRDTGAASGSNARVLVGVLCVVAVLACVVMPLFGWVVAFVVAIRFAVLARRAADPSLFRVAGWAMVALGVVNVAVIAVLSSGSDQVELTRNSGPGLNLPGVTGVDPDGYRNGLALAGDLLAQREAELARIAETSPAVTAQLDAGTKPFDASAPTACSVVMFDQRGSTSWVYLDCVRDQVGFSAPAIVAGSAVTIPGTAGTEGLVAAGFPAEVAAGITAYATALAND
jgi:hypothetical protein